MPTTKSQNENVLLVEDDPTILGMTKKILEMRGHTVFPANTPAEAVKISESHKGEIDLLLTDVVIPHMTCKELTKLVQSRRPNMKILFMSGYTANVIVHNGILDTGIHFIQKPYPWLI